MDPSPDTLSAPLAYSIDGAAKATTLCRSKIYEYVRQGKIETRKLGRRTVIPADSLRRFIEEGA